MGQGWAVAVQGNLAQPSQYLCRHSFFNTIPTGAYMANIGIFFGTDTGKTRKIAKMIHKQLGEPPPPRSILTAPRWRPAGLPGPAAGDADAGRRPAAGR
jgi:hypothetical protein